MITAKSTLRRALSAAVALAALAPATALAAPGDVSVVTGTATVLVVEPFTITPLQDLRFGAMAQPIVAGTVTVSPASVVTSTYDLSAFPGGRGAAEFFVFGDPNRRFLTFLPNTATISNGAASMTVNNFTANVTPGGTRLNAAGQYFLRVGGRLNVNANQAPGSYSGTFNVRVIYL